MYPFMIVRLLGVLKLTLNHKLQAIEHLKAFEKKDQHLKAMAATNLAFIHFLEGGYHKRTNATQSEVLRR